MAPDRFETIAWVYSQAQLAMILSRLEAENIYVLPFARGHVSVDWGLTLALGGVEIRVHPAEAEAARALFTDIEQVPSRRRVSTANRAFDALIMVVLMLAVAIPPPARIPATFSARPAAVRRAGS